MFRLRLALIHLGASVLLALITLVLVFFIWYPQPFAAMLGVTHLYLIILLVDTVCGPCFTFLLANPRKSKRELRLDLSLVVLIQLVALIYGLYAVAMGRPVALVLEKDRLVAVTANEISPAQLQQAPAPYNRLPWFTRYQAGVREPADNNEYLHSIELSLAGLPPSLRPSWWVPYQDVLPAIERIRKKLPVLYKAQDAQGQQTIMAAVKNTGYTLEQLYYLPFTSKKSLEWAVLLNAESDIIGFAEVDAFETPGSEPESEQ